MNRFSAFDELIQLSRLVDAKELGVLLQSAASLHPVAIEVCDSSGEVLGHCGVMEREAAYRRDLVYAGETIGEVLVLPLEASCTPHVVEAMAQHIVTTLAQLVHSAYGLELTTVVHQAAMKESFADLGDRNIRLAAAIERLKELDQLKSNFLSTISHELRTPLTSIIGYSELLSEGLAGALSKEQEDCIQAVLGKADELLQLITGILDVALIEAGSLRLALHPVNLLDLIAGIAADMRRDLKRRDLVLDLPTELVPRALGDGPKLRQVMLHLIANAVKFSPSGGEIKVSLGVGPLSPDDSSSFHSPLWRDRLSERFGLRITVTDHGIGIPSEQRASIFEPFYQVDSGTTRAFGGTGLGLSLAKSYIIAHGGFLWVESRECGPGSVFTCTLPAVPEELAAFVERVGAHPAPADCSS